MKFIVHHSALIDHHWFRPPLPPSGACHARDALSPRSTIAKPAPHAVHAAVVWRTARRPRDARGVVDALVRLSVGIEDIDDLVKDLEAGLAKVTVLAGSAK